MADAAADFGLPISDGQLPVLHHVVQEAAARLGMTHPPSAYLLNSPSAAVYCLQGSGGVARGGSEGSGGSWDAAEGPPVLVVTSCLLELLQPGELLSAVCGALSVHSMPGQILIGFNDRFNGCGTLLVCIGLLLRDLGARFWCARSVSDMFLVLRKACKVFIGDSQKWVCI